MTKPVSCGFAGFRSPTACGGFSRSIFRSMGSIRDASHRAFQRVLNRQADAFVHVYVVPLCTGIHTPCQVWDCKS